jgi:hypothetical protein
MTHITPSGEPKIEARGRHLRRFFDVSLGRRRTVANIAHRPKSRIPAEHLPPAKGQLLLAFGDWGR